MPEPKIIFDSFQGALAGSKELSTPAKTEFEKDVLAFVDAWLSDQQEFEFNTSGSTGPPGKITFNRDSIKASVKLTKEKFRLDNDQTALLCLSPKFVAGKMMIARALEIGMNLLCCPPVADPLAEMSWDSEVHFAALVPYQVSAIIENDASSKKLSRIKNIIVGGSPVDQSLTDRLQQFGNSFFETYGMTETLTHIAIRKLNPPEKDFKLLPGITAFIDERLCLNIQASHLSDQVIKTNDIAEFTTPDTFQIIGRFDNIVNSAGFKIVPEDVERKISSIIRSNLPNVNFIAGGIPDNDFGQKLVLLVETREIKTEIKNEVISQIKSVLKKWEVPKDVLAVSTFRRTESGKINRRETLASLIAG